MKPDIRFDTRLQPPRRCRRAAFRKESFDLFDILLRTPSGSPLDDGDLQYSPHFVQVADVGTAETLRHRVVRRRPALDKRPGSLLHFQEPHVNQYLHSFAHRRTADAENTHQFRLGRQFFAYLELPVRNPLAEPFGQLFGQRSFPYDRIRSLFHHII